MSDQPASHVDNSVALPTVMTPAIGDLLGMPNFRTGPIAHLFRAAGFDIKRRCEDEQAFVLHRWLPLAILHGDMWREEARKDLDAQQAKIETVRNAERAAAEQKDAR